MKLTGQQGQQQPDSITIPLSPIKTRKKTTFPVSPPNPNQQQQATVQQATVQKVVSVRPSPMTVQTLKSKNTAADLVDLFDDDNADNYLLPSKTLIETEIKEPTSSLDSLQAAILAIEKINQAASDKKKSTSYLEDDEAELNSKLESHLVASLKRTPTKRPTPATTFAPKKVPAGLRQPINKTKKKDQADEEGEDDDETSEEDDEDDDEAEFRYRTGSRLPDPLDPKRRDFVPVPTKDVQFQDASQLTVPATQTFVKKHLQIQESAAASSSEEEEPAQRRMLTVTRRKVRRPRILYPQEDFEKPVFIPL